MKEWIAFVVVVGVIWGAGFIGGMSVGRAMTNDIVVKERAKHERSAFNLKSKHARSIEGWEQKVIIKQEKYEELLRLFNQFKNHPFFPHPFY